MSSFFSEHCIFLWYILFLLLLSWMKTNIQTAYITFINSLETRGDDTMEKDRKFAVKEQRHGKLHQPELLCPLSHHFKTIPSKGSQIQSLHSFSRCGWFIYCFRVVVSRGSFGFGSWRLVGPLVKLLNI